MVPKRKECDTCNTFQYPSGKNYRQCKHEKTKNREITSNEFKTSPKWCPKRA